MVVDLTEKALEEIKKIVKSKGTEKALRIYIAGYGWGGPSFGLALDEHKDGDSKTKVDDLTFLLEEGLEENFDKFTIDFSDSMLKRGFTVNVSGAAGGC